MKTKTVTNPHRWFYSYLKTVDGYPQYKDVIKEALVSEYSHQQTESLSDMYANYRELYDRMRKDLTAKQPMKSGKIQFDPVMDLARRRLIAVIFDWLRLQGINKDIDYVKQIACNAAKEKKFNHIPLAKLEDLYRRFGKKKEPIMNEWATGILDKISKEV